MIETLLRRISACSCYLAGVFSATRNVQALAFVVLTLPLLLSVIIPPFGGKDEHLHWYRVHQIASGSLLSSNLSENQFGGEIDRHAWDFFHWVFTRIEKKQPIPPEEAFVTAETWGSLPKEYVTISFSPTATYSPLAYIPQAVALAVAKLFTGNYIYQMIAMRYLNSLVYLVSILAIASVFPFANRFFLAIAFVPSAVFNSASLSADPMNITIPALLLALCMRWRTQPDTPLDSRERWLCIGLCAALGLLKPFAILFAAVALLIPRTRFASRRDHLQFLTLCFGVAFVVAWGWALRHPLVPGVFWQTGADPIATLQDIRADPLGALGVLWSNISRFYGLWWWDSYAAFGGHPDPYSLITPVDLSSAAFFFCLALAIVDGPRRIDFWQAAVLAGTAVAYFLLVLIAFMVGFAKPGSLDITGIQGRYFYLPVIMVGIALGSVLPIRAWFEKVANTISIAICWYLAFSFSLILTIVILYLHKVWPI